MILTEISNTNRWDSGPRLFDDNSRPGNAFFMKSDIGKSPESRISPARDFSTSTYCIVEVMEKKSGPDGGASLWSCHLCNVHNIANCERHSSCLAHSNRSAFLENNRSHLFYFLVPQYSKEHGFTMCPYVWTCRITGKFRASAHSWISCLKLHPSDISDRYVDGQNLSFDSQSPCIKNEEDVCRQSLSASPKQIKIFCSEDSAETDDESYDSEENLDQPESTESDMEMDFGEMLRPSSSDHSISLSEVATEEDAPRATHEQKLLEEFFFGSSHDIRFDAGQEDCSVNTSFSELMGGSFAKTISRKDDIILFSKMLGNDFDEMFHPVLNCDKSESLQAQTPRTKAKNCIAELAFCCGK